MVSSFRQAFCEKLQATLLTYGVSLLQRRVLVAVSGGPDSCVLLDALARLAGEWGMQLRICHVHHGLRGEEAMEDQRHVAELAERYDLSLTVRRFDADEVERIRAGNLEELARELRYHKLAHTAQELNCHYIATGHTRSDQAETVLHRLIRSCGLSGLSAIHPVAYWQGETFIRPLLRHTREEILHYAREADLTFRTDSMNLDPRFTRIRIRQQLLPLLQDAFNPNIEESLSQLAELAREEDVFWDKHLEDLAARVGSATPEHPADRIALMALSKAEQRRLLRRIFRLQGIEAGMNHVEEALQLLAGGKPQGEIHLPGGKRLYRRYDGFYLAEATVALTDTRTNPLAIPGITPIPALGIQVQAEILPANLVALKPKEKRSARFDAAKVQHPVVIRTRLEGDAIQPLGMEGTKKLKKIFQEKRIALEARDRVPIICFGDTVAWVVGLCESERFRVESSSQSILKLTVLDRDEK